MDLDIRATRTSANMLDGPRCLCANAGLGAKGLLVLCQDCRACSTAKNASALDGPFGTESTTECWPGCDIVFLACEEQIEAHAAQSS